MQIGEECDWIMNEQEIVSLIKKHTDLRIGSGFDVHQLVEGRPLIIGGVTIPHTKGLLGHSDADVLLHAIMDSLLGAAKLGDIGVHFPDTDPEWKGADSLKLTEAVGSLVRKAGFEILNIDSLVIAQKPKMSPYFDIMASNVAKALQIEPSRVSVKATTTEKLGFCGRMEGIASTSSALLRRV